MFLLFQGVRKYVRFQNYSANLKVTFFQDATHFGRIGIRVPEEPVHSIIKTPDGGNRFLRNVGTLLPKYTAAHSRRQ
jgi:hypothetical protein